MGETKHKHEYELKISGFETLSDDINKQFELLEKELETNSAVQQQVVNTMLGNIKTGYKDAYSTINTLIKNTGVTISDTTTKAVEGVSSLTGAITLLNTAVKDTNKTKPSLTAQKVKTENVQTNLTSYKNNKGKPITTNKALIEAAKLDNLKDVGKEPAKPTKPATPTKKPSDAGTSTGKATKISLNKTSATIKVGGTVSLTASCKPVNASVEYTWKSSNTSVATVSQGKVKGKKKGTATITVTDKKSGKTATCKVTVKADATSSGKKPSSSSSSSVSIWTNIPKDDSMKGNPSLDQNSIQDMMQYYGYTGNYSTQKQLWKNLNGSGTYTGTSEQNIWLLNQLKKAAANGFMISTGSSSNTAASNSSIWANIPKDNSMKGNSSLDKNSIKDMMQYYGYAGNYSTQKQLWKNLNGSGTYTGTSAQNTWLLEQLKKAAAKGFTTSTSSSTSTSTTSSAGVWANIPKDTSMKGNSSLDKNHSIADRMKYHGYAGNYSTQKQLWSNLKGSGTYTGTAAQNSWLIEQLKKAGYSTGGVVTGNPVAILGKAAKASGDDGIGILSKGEVVMPTRFTELMPQGLKILEAVSKIDVPAHNVSGQAPIINTNLVFNVDQISNDIDLEAFSRKIQKEVSQNICREVKKLR